MENKEYLRKIRLLGILLIFSFILFNVLPKTCSAQSPIICNIRATDQTSAACTISWVTDINSDAVVYYSTDPNGTFLSQSATDTNTKLHRVVIISLTELTTYYYYVASGTTIDDNDGQYYTFTTAKPGIGSFGTVTCKVLQPDGNTPAENIFIYLTVTVNGTSVSNTSLGVSNSSGLSYWLLGNLKDSAGDAFNYGAGSAILTIEAQGGDIGHFFDDNIPMNLDQYKQQNLTDKVLSPCNLGYYYKDADSDGYGDESDKVCQCSAQGDYTATQGGDCNDDNAAINPGMTETCNNLDDDCDGTIDNGSFTIITGTDVGECQQGITDCVGGAMVVTQTEIGPSAETCNGVDDDCDGTIDNGSFAITTGTDVGECQQGITDCVGGSMVVTQTEIGPTTEVCNGLDDNCDGSIDEGFPSQIFYRDADSDSYGDPNNTTQDCVVPAGFVDNSADCDDTDDSIKPGATEKYDGIDNNCNGQVDENCFFISTLKLEGTSKLAVTEDASVDFGLSSPALTDNFYYNWSSSGLVMLQLIQTAADTGNILDSDLLITDIRVSENANDIFWYVEIDEDTNNIDGNPRFTWNTGDLATMCTKPFTTRGNYVLQIRKGLSKDGAVLVGDMTAQSSYQINDADGTQFTIVWREKPYVPPQQTIQRPTTCVWPNCVLLPWLVPTPNSSNLYGGTACNGPFCGAVYSSNTLLGGLYGGGLYSSIIYGRSTILGGLYGGTSLLGGLYGGTSLLGGLYGGGLYGVGLYGSGLYAGGLYAGGLYSGGTVLGGNLYGGGGSILGGLLYNANSVI